MTHVIGYGYTYLIYTNKLYLNNVDNVIRVYHVYMKTFRKITLYVLLW